MRSSLQEICDGAALARWKPGDEAGLQLLSANTALCRLIGYGEEEFLSLGLGAIWGPKTQPDQLRRLEDALREGTRSKIELLAYCKDQSPSAVVLTTAPLTGAPEPGIYWMLTLRPIVQESRDTNSGITEILETTTDSVVALDTEWRFIYLNSKAMHELSCDRDLLGQVIWDAFPDSVNTSIEENYRCAMREQRSVAFEAFYPPLNSWFEIRAHPTPRQLNIFFRNINRRKQGQAKILAHQEELLQSQRLARLCSWRSDSGKGWIHFSKTVPEVIASCLRPEGCSIAEFTGKLHPDDRHAAEKLLTQPLAPGEPGDIRVRLQLEEEDRFLLLRAQPGGSVLISGMMQDVTDQKRAELARQSMENRFRRVFESAMVGIAINTLEGRFIDVNPAFEEATGYSREELLAMNFRDLIHPDDRENNVRLVEQLIAGEIPPFTLVKRNLSKSGETFWIQVQVSMLVDELAGTRHLMAIIRNITDQKNAEEALQRSEVQLRQAQKMDAVGQLAGGIAHDFNNLLTVINGYSSMLLAQMSEGAPARGPIEQIFKTGEKAAALTNQLLAFSRKQVLQPNTLEMNQVLQAMEPLLRRLIREDIELGFRLAPAPAHVRVNLSQLEQVILNLCINARDAMPGGGRLTLSVEMMMLTEGGAKQCGVLKPGEYVLIKVSDTGCGMDEETRSRAFDPFFTTKEKESGTGLGLATVYGIARQAGGHVALDSAPAAGTTVRIYLPRVQPEGEVKTPLAANPCPARGRETILLVEDEVDIRTFLCDILRQNGYRVLAADNGNEAVFLGNKHAEPIDLLITDIIMPGMNGRVLAETLRGIHPEIQVLYISGYTGNALDPAAARSEEWMLLQKPFTPRHLLGNIRELLDGKKLDTATSDPR